MGYIDGALTYLVQLSYEFLKALFYPVTAFLTIFIEQAVQVWHVFYSFVTALTGLFNTFYSLVHTYFSLAFPSIWVVVIMIGLLTVIALRVYSFVKDVSIFGFKI